MNSNEVFTNIRNKNERRWQTRSFHIFHQDCISIIKPDLFRLTLNSSSCQTNNRHKCQIYFTAKKNRKNISLTQTKRSKAKLKNVQPRRNIESAETKQPMIFDYRRVILSHIVGKYPYYHLKTFFIKTFHGKSTFFVCTNI